MIYLFKKHRLIFITVVYWFLLIYIVAALVWWFIELNNQNKQMYDYQLTLLKKDDPDYLQKSAQITDSSKRKTAQYIGEGATFLLLILFCAVFVYRAVKRQIKLSLQQQNFMMAVTHELKTPVTIVRLNLETMQKRLLDEDTKKQLLEKTIEETDRRNHLTHNILVTSQLESGSYILSKSEIDFSELVTKAVIDFQKRFPGRTIKEYITADVLAEGEYNLLEMVVSNLMENATKYTPAASDISVTLKKNNGHIILHVADFGAGINDDEKKKIFEKFYRSGNENTRLAKGTGLGLYLCLKIVKDHKGKIAVTDNIPAGSIFTITMPAL